MSTWRIAHTGDKAAPGFWLMAAAACGIVSTLALYRSGRFVANPAAGAHA